MTKRNESTIAGLTPAELDLLAAYLYAQLEERARIQRRRRRIWQAYRRGLEGWAEDNGVSLPTVPDECEQCYHMFYLLLPSAQHRQAMIDHLKSHGILSVFHYQPLHLSEMGRRFGGELGDCPVTERICDRLLRLPFFNTLASAQQNHILDAVVAFST